MDKELIGKAGEIIKGIISKGGFCSLALINLEGYPTVSTITPAKADGINWITFDTGLGSNKANRINKCDRASVCFNSSDPLYNITLVGTIEILTDEKTKKENWYKGMEDHFKGPEDPGYCVLKFKTERYNFFGEWSNWSEISGKL
jgi:general stress protein 26